MKKIGLISITFISIFLLSYVVKPLFFIYADKVTFALGGPSPPPLAYWNASIKSLIFATIFFFFFAIGVIFTNNKHSLRPANNSKPHRSHLVILYIICTAGIAGLFFLNRSTILGKLHNPASIFLRTVTMSNSAFTNGQVGVVAFFVQICGFFPFFASTVGVMKRKVSFLILGCVGLLISLIASDGSRFTQLTALLYIPFLIITELGLHKNKFIKICVIITIIFILPCVAGLLSALRYGLPLNMQNVGGLALSTFDVFDHFVSYSIHPNLDYIKLDGAKRFIQEVYQFIPRYFWSSKPRIYGITSLQEQIYPGTVGIIQGTTYAPGNYPLGIMVTIIDPVFPLGFVLLSILSGIILGFADLGLSSRSLNGRTVGMMIFFTCLHLIRSGPYVFLFSLITTCCIPIILTKVSEHFFYFFETLFSMLVLRCTKK